MRTEIDPAEWKRYGARFEEWYKVYSRKTNKGDARKAWIQIMRQVESFGEDLDEFVDYLINRTRLLMNTSKGSRDRRAYIPYPATFLRGERWEDDLAEWKTCNGRLDSTPQKENWAAKQLEQIKEGQPR